MATLTGVPPTRTELDAWWLAYEQAAEDGIDIRGWLDGHPYPTSSPEHAARVRRMILKQVLS